MRFFAAIMFAAGILAGIAAYGQYVAFDPTNYTSPDARVAAQVVFNLFGGLALFCPILGVLAVREAYRPNMRNARQWRREQRKIARARLRSLNSGLRGWEKTLAS